MIKDQPLVPEDLTRRQYTSAIERALSHRLVADLRNPSGPLDIDRRVLDRVVSRTSVADLTIDGLAEVIAGALQAQRQELVAHIGRVFKTLTLMNQHSSDPNARTRAKNFHRRITILESAVQQLRKGSK